jgi:anti-sigma factor ChrR (cupin superfamily)
MRPLNQGYHPSPMTKTTTKVILGAAVLVTVAGLSYAAGAAKAKQEPVRVPAGELHWEPYAPGVPLQVASLWGDRKKGGDYGMLLKFPAGFDSGMHAHTLDYRAVAVQGTWVHTQEGEPGAPELAPGSFVMQPGKQFHSDACKGKQDCIVFIHQHGKGDYIPAPAKK